MAILFSDHTYRSEKLYDTLRQHMPEVDLRRWPEIGQPEEIDYAIIWYPAPDSLQNLPNLKVIFTTSAGVDGIIHDATLPAHIPIVRNGDPNLAVGVAEYVVYNVLRFHRYFHVFEEQQRAKLWQQKPQPLAQNCRVGIMGLGEMGGLCAKRLVEMGFAVRGWSRTPKQIASVQSFAGDGALPDFLAATDILVNCLPLTDATLEILNAALFAQLPKGAFLINAGRGKHMVEADLLAALDSGQLSAAALDVFAVEPLPADNPLWSHPKITLTPHIASITDLGTIARNVLRQITEFEAGQSLNHVVDRQKQY